MDPSDSPGALHDAVEALRTARDQLLTASTEWVKDGGREEWDAGDLCFTLARETDALADRATALLDGGPTPLREHQTPAGRPQPKGRRGYPRYRVQGDVLRKTGLRRDKSTEYQQAVPRSHYERIGEAIVAAGRARSEFRADTVIETTGVPAYEVYIVLGLMKAHGIITSPRRGYYTTTDPERITDAMDRTWSELEGGTGHRANRGSQS